VSDRAAHWDGVYGTKRLTEVSWYEREPTTSLRLVEALAPGPAARCIDIGAGASPLVDRLLAQGFRDLTVLDVSERALSVVRERLGAAGQSVTFVCEDVLTWVPDRQFDVWHDRAVFHFLTDPDARERYMATAARAVPTGGGLVLATFASDGPSQCSGLPVCRYSGERLAALFAPSFSLIAAEREEHVTPGGAVQPFTWVTLRRT
jgi:2-polyprenyl-3-methyl-5-hydroxy-6-metoxy-1,4-benzoquinol methylase